MNQFHIQQYVSGRMGEEEAQAFEEYCLSNPEFARQVEFEQRLKAGIAQVARGDTSEFVRSNHPLGWQLAAAAGIAFLVFAGFFAWHRSAPRATPEIMAAVTSADQRNGRSVRLALVRGESTPELPGKLLRVEIAGLFDPAFQYSVALDRLDAKRNIDTVATLYGQRPSSPVTLEVMLDVGQIESGTYSLRVRKQGSDEEALDFEFLKH